MGKVAIIDDDKQFANVLKLKIEPFFKTHGDIIVFDSFDKKYFQKHNISIVFLDIEIGVVNGIHVAKEIRQLENSPIIIFVSNKDGLVHNTLEVQPLYFIRKTKLEEDVTKALSLLRTVSFRENDTIDVGGTIIKIKDILYIESSDHKITFNTIDNKLTCRGTLESMVEQLEDYYFVRAHRSYVLNIRQIERHYSSRVILKTGQTIEIGRRYQQGIKTKYREVKLNGII